MKLEEAASILGISLEDITIDGLKQTYKRLAMAWDPEKCKDHSSKLKYQRISEAYRKLNSVMEGSEGHKGDDSHEIAAFMRMFMDMVGISDTDSIPAAMTFGMMFGSRQESLDEWSTDDEEDGEYNDCDDDDDYDDDEDEDDESFDLPRAVETSFPWEPQAKQYSNMNLKDQISKQKLQSDILNDAGLQANGVGLNGSGQTGGVGLNDAEREKKLKQAKKRADKRRKQKERRLKDQACADATTSTSSGVATVNDATVGVGYCTRSTTMKEVEYTKESISLTKSSLIKLSADAGFNQQELKRLLLLNVNEIVLELTTCVTNGQLGKVNQILSYDFSEEIPGLVANEMISVLKQQLPGVPILHHCVTNHASDASTSHNLAARRIEVAKYLLNFRNPAFDLGVADASGLSVLHLAVVCGDVKVAQMIIRAFTEGTVERKSQLNINSRCRRQGWAPIHYAVDKCHLESLRLLIHNRANILVTMATDKRYTPLQLARVRLKAASSPVISAVYKSIIEELETAIEQQKTAKDAEKVKKSSDGLEDLTIEDLSRLLDEKPTTAEKTTASEKKSKKKKAEKKKDKAPAKAQSTPSASLKVEPLPAASNPQSSPVASKPQSTPPVSTKPLPSPPVPTKVQQPPTVPAAIADQKGQSTSKAMVDKGKGPSKPVVTASAGVANKKGPVPPSSTPTPTSSSAPAPVAQIATNSIISEMSIASRDELVDRLLAMGFREADCLVAISLYGTDMDQAISWLCDRPTPAALLKEIKPKGSNEATGGSANSSTHAVGTSTSYSSNSSTEATSIGSSTTNTANVNANPNSNNNVAANSTTIPKLQKEKEELRRINRAWNAKAEDEKRKAEAQRKQAELQKQTEALQAKQQQQEQLRLQQQIQQQQLLYYQQQQQQYLQQQQSLSGSSYYPLQTSSTTGFVANSVQSMGNSGLMAPSPPLSASPSYSHLGGLHTDSHSPLQQMTGASMSGTTGSVSLHSNPGSGNGLSMDAPPTTSGPHRVMPFLTTAQGPLSHTNNPSYSLNSHNILPSNLLSSHNHQQQNPSPSMVNSKSVDLNNIGINTNQHYSLQSNTAGGGYSSNHLNANYNAPSSSAANYSATQPAQDSWSNPGYRSSLGSHMEHLYTSKAYNSSHDIGMGASYNTPSPRLGTDSVDIIDGALELSAVAKEFVPSSARSVPAYGPNNAASKPSPPMPALTPVLPGTGMGSSLLHHHPHHPPMLYQPSPSSSSTGSRVGVAVIGHPPGMVRGVGASMTSMPPSPLTASQSTWKPVSTTAPFMTEHNSPPGIPPLLGHINPPGIPPLLDTSQLQSQGHSIFMSSYHQHLNGSGNNSFHIGSSVTSSPLPIDSDVFEYDPSAIMTDIDSFLSTDN